MWYLKTDTFLILAAFSLLAGALRRYCPARVFSAVLPALSLAVLFSISRRLCCFYIAYILLGAGCARLLKKWRRGLLFALLSLGATVPFFFSRLDSFGIQPPFLFVSTGIAFAMLKLIDVFYFVYYADMEIDPFTFANYMLLLPVFTAGPIFRYRDFLVTHSAPLKIDAVLFTESFGRIVRGLFKKIIIAQAASLAMARLMAMSEHWYVSLCAIICSYLILYFDLSGYSDIAIAFGRLAGYDVPENFKRPWSAASFTQFWRCWHATLSDWIREHIYVAVGRRRLGRGATAAIAMGTMTIMALWHGFNIPYLLAGENLLGLTTVSRRKTKKPVYILRCACVNLLFAVNTLVFTLNTEQVFFVLRGLTHR